MGITYNKKLVKKDRVISGRGPRDLQNKQNVPIPVRSSTASVDELRRQITALTEQLQGNPVDSVGLFTPEQVDDEILKALKAETAQIRLDYEKQLKVVELKAADISNKANDIERRNNDLVTKLAALETEIEVNTNKITNEIKSKYDKLLDERDSHLDTLKKSHQVELAAFKTKITTLDEIIDTLRSAATAVTTDGLSVEVMESLLIAAAERFERAAASVSNGEVVGDPDRPQMEDVFIDPLEERKSELEHKIVVEDVSHVEKEAMADKVSKLKSLMGKLPSR